MVSKYEQVSCDALDGRTRPLCSSSRKHRKAVSSYWSVCRSQTGLKLHGSELQVHRNIWTGSGITESPHSRQQNRADGVVCLGVQAARRAGATGACTAVSPQSDSGTSANTSTNPSAGAKVYDHHYLQNDFSCWLLRYVIHMLPADSSVLPLF